MITALWGLAAALALLWPDHISGPFDGVPLDRAVEAVLVGMVVPSLWWFDPGFLRTTRARACIAALLAWKILSSVLFVQDGLCVRFEPARPFAKGAGRVPHSWDLRSDWTAYEPQCSAVMTRSYRDAYEFPVWFFNLPPPSESWPVPADLPPDAVVGIRVHGYVTARRDGMLRFEMGQHITGALSVDGRGVQGDVPVAAGIHNVDFDGTMTGFLWLLLPQWSGDELWDGAIATLHRPSRLDIAVRPWIAWVPTTLAAALVSLWIWSALAAAGTWPMLAWTAGMAVTIGMLRHADKTGLAAWMVVGLAAAAAVPVPPRHRNMRGAFLLVIVPWLAFVLMNGYPDIGRGRLYEWGNDFWMYQRYAYRIVMQGYWLEGGSPTFYFQPFYRWIVGVLHAIFGDSSVGERFWDGFALAAGSMVSFHITRTFAGFRWGVVGAAVPLAVFVLGTAHYLMGFGLGEISSAGLLSIAALCAIRSRRRGWAPAIAAGILATLAFYTRLNNGIMAAGISIFALPLDVRVRDLPHPSAWRRRVAWSTVTAVWSCLAVGLLFFAWRTYHYTGVFSVFYGTQRYIVAVWQPRLALSTILENLATSVGKVLTVNDPPRFDVYALPVMLGALVGLLSLAGVPRLRDLPAAAVLFFWASIASAFVAYGWVYPGRFSIHVLPITGALATCAAARLSMRSHPAAEPVVPVGEHVVDERIE